jgi:hypothetical protein
MASGVASGRMALVRRVWSRAAHLRGGRVL